MESNYDEDLSDNVFFQTLQKDYFELYQKATTEGWIICVPRAGCLPKYALTHKDFFSHILVPSDELPETHFRTLNDRDVRIFNRVVTVEPNDSAVPFSTHILFEETYYTEDMLKYKVFCTEYSLEQYSTNIRGESGIVTVSTLRDCIDLLWTEGCKEVLELMDDVLLEFLSVHEDLEFKSLQVQKDLIGGLYTHCLQVALNDSRLGEKASVNSHLLDNVKISVESYMHHGIYKKLIKGITTCTAYDDACFNKIIRNLTDIQLRDLDINTDFQEAVPRARSELSKIEAYSTVLGKVGCIQRTLSSISKSGSNNELLGADDLLPMLVFLVIKSGLPNWTAHLTYIKEFSYSFNSFYANQYNFLVTSLEAAIEHVKSGAFFGSSEPESQSSMDMDTNNSFTLNLTREMSDNSLSKIFDMVRLGNCDVVQSLVKEGESHSQGSLEKLNLCHPLCSCDKCERAIGLMMCNTSPTVNSCDDRGFTVLHIAAMYGRPKIVDMLLSLGANPNVSDYKGSTPLHYAASRGHQNALLLIAHAGSKLLDVDNEGNTPLHLAVSNGHEDCVKALIYFAEHNNSTFNINHVNKKGDTALHNASRWGYENIVTLLLEYGANPGLENKSKKTPSDYAHNLNISRILRTHHNVWRSLDSRDITVAAASMMRLDLNQDSKHVRPSTTAQIKKLDRLFSAIIHGDVPLATYYLGLEERSGEGCHPLCECRNREGCGAEEGVSVGMCDASGQSALHVAATHGREVLVRRLLAAGADPSLATRSSCSLALHLASAGSHTETACLLAAHAPNTLAAQDSLGNTPLHYACLTTNVKLVQFLLKLSPNLKIKNYQGQTPFDISKQITSLTLIQLLNNFDKLQEK